jgi:cytosine/uracil/thiamine/allantoin permease
MNIQIGANTKRTIALVIIWTIAAVLLHYDAISFRREFFGTLAVMALMFALPTMLTYFVIKGAHYAGLMTLATAKDKQPHSHRVQHWLESLDDNELDALRDRLQADNLFEFKPKREIWEQ